MNSKNLCRYCGKNKINCESSIEDANNILEAVRKNDLNRIKFLIQGGKSPNIHNSMGYTALHRAVIEERTDIVEYLLTLSEINLEHRTEGYEISLLLSVRLENAEIARMLIRQATDLKVFDINGKKLLTKAVLSHYTEKLKFFLTESFDVNHIINNGKTLLHAAVRCNDFELVSALLYFNVDTHIMDNRGYTPFITALTYNCDENIQRELFKYEYDYNRETYYGNTLAQAVHGRSPLITDLIENGADINYYSDSMYRSILATILEKCDPEIFFYVFPLTNLLILIEFEESIFTSFLRCDYNNEDWLKALYLILESDVLSELIDHYYILTKKNDSGIKYSVSCCSFRSIHQPKLRDNIGLFGKFAEVFEKKNISEEEFVKFIEICLCSGAEVLFEDIKYVYEVYSNNNALLHLLNMKMTNFPGRGSTLPHIFCSFNISFESTLHEYYNYGKRARLKLNSIPTLLELSRNEAIISICTRYNIKSSYWYYYILRRLNLPKIIYDFLTFRRLIE